MVTITNTETISQFLNSLNISSNLSIKYQPTYNELFKYESDSNLTAYESARETNLGAMAVDTGKFTGRSANDKYIVKDSASENNVWWSDEGSTNKSITQHTWNHLKKLCVKQLVNKHLFVIDGFCGANKSTRIPVRLVTEVAWQAHFFKNMFIRPTEDEITSFEPIFTILNACKTSCKDYETYGLRSETFIAFNLTEKIQLIGGTWYGGEMKKGIFSIMNYFLPLQGIGALHCSANQGVRGDTALFFGLSGTGKTTLSADPKRSLIGDDEHGWDEDGIFNFEGGCYAKTIDLSKEKEPDIYQAIKRNALLENVVLKSDGSVNFNDGSKTQNTRVSYPIYHIDNIVKPVSKGSHPKNIIFLTCDAYGVLPPVSKLTKEQAMYQYLSGYTAKVAGTELGITEPTATFSACFGAPFLTVHPIKYAKILASKMEAHNANAYLVNTGWIGGAYGIGERISLKNTRLIIDAILDGSLEDSKYETSRFFKVMIPKQIHGISSSILNPAIAWSNQDKYQETAQKLVTLFTDNFKKFDHFSEVRDLSKFGPEF